MALSHGRLRDELLLHLGHRGAKVYVMQHEDGIIDLLKSQSVDCILTQMALKDKDAIELVLRVHDIDSTVPIILVDQTGNHHQDVAARLKVAAYFEKPQSSFDVFRAIEKSLGWNGKMTVSQKNGE